jgi:hypothetical protein
MSYLRSRSFTETELSSGVVAGFEKGQMKSAKKIKWDSAFFMARADPEWKPQPRRESKKLPDIPFSFDFEKCRKAWAAVGVTVNEAAVKIHIVELAAWQRRWKK